MKKRIAIIGSGIGGLTAANLLIKNSDIEIIVYEKEKMLSLDEGYGIQLAPNSISILNKIGFRNIDKNDIFNPLKLNFYSNNNKICDLDLGKFNNESIKYTTLQRSTLIEFLKDKLFTNNFRFGKEVKKVSKIKDKLLINFSDNTNDFVDFIIVSDGVFSNTKSIIENKVIKPLYNGSIAIRTVIKFSEEFNYESKNISLIMSSNSHLVLYPINQRKEINLVCVVRKKLGDIRPTEKLLNSTFLKEHKHFANFFKEDLKSWNIYTSLKPFKSKYKNVIYVGDAFFAFPPTMAQGASQAIESANEIFELLTQNHMDIENEYFKNRVKKTNLIKKRSKINYFAFHISNPLLKVLRNGLLKRLVKNKNFINTYLGRIYR